MKKFIPLVLLLLCGSSAPAADIETVDTDLLVVGATESGWAAAIQAARNGVPSITIVHDGVWFGGQYTEQALACVDEDKGVGNVGWGVPWHPMKRSFHRSGLFKELMDRIEQFNTEKYGSPMPGKPFHGPSTFRPAEAETVFRGMIQPYIDSGQVQVYWNRTAVRADMVDSRLRGVSFAPEDAESPDLHVTARLTIDASDWGDVIQISGTAFECGPDPQSRYGEASAPRDLSENPANELNPITWAMIVAEADGDTPIARPPRFDDRNYPRATHLSHAAFRNLKWDHPRPGLGSIPHWPDAGKASPRQLTVFNVRRIVDGYESRDGRTSILLNYMNGQDYPLERLPQHVVDALEATEPGASMKNLVVMTPAQRRIVFEDAKQHSLGVLYHLQNFVHERADDTTNSFRHFELSDEFGTVDHLPPKPYIRESLRLKSMYMMREQDGRNRDGETKTSARERFAHVMYPDGLFAWQFHYDFHRTGRTYLTDEGPSGPWIDYHKPNRHTSFVSDRSVFPLRSLVPQKTDGLLGAQGNVGFSSIVSAAIRLHDQRIHIGQAAGATAAVALRENIDPREIPYDRGHLEAVRNALCGEVDDAVPLLLWPYRDLAASHPAFVAVNRLSALGVVPSPPREVDFQPDAPATAEWIAGIRHDERVAAAVENVSLAIAPDAAMTRGAFCQALWQNLAQQGWDAFAFTRHAPDDADQDGIRDADDPLPFTPNPPIVFEIERPELEPSNDGIPDDPVAADTIRFFDFRGPTSSAGDNSLSYDHGRPFDDARGYGWNADLRNNHRQRNALSGPRDTFIFTRNRNVWECAVEPGRYRVTVCFGDSGHEQLQQHAVLEGDVVADHVTTAAGTFFEATAEVTVDDGRLTLELGSGRPSSNTCINWLRIER